MNTRFREIPKVDKLLEWDEIQFIAEHISHEMAVTLCRQVLDDTRQQLTKEDPRPVDALVQENMRRRLSVFNRRPLQHVINASGVILHTNLGRATFDKDLLDDVFTKILGSTCLEIDLNSGQRGVRGDFVREQLANLCGAEAALVVNNNAAAVLLVLSALAKDRDVIVSRGELVQIGGGFRIPDVIVQGGARLKEVGSTNVTTLQDYEQAMSDDTAALIRIHHSNFHMKGFVSRPTTAELSRLKTNTCLLIEDVGSGCLLSEWNHQPLPDPTPKQILADGADLICMSGDKLLGGPQAGIIAGRKDLIDRLAAFPLMRAIRPCKFTYTMLEAVCSRYATGKAHTLSPWRHLSQTTESLTKRVEAFRERLGMTLEAHPIKATKGCFGAGSLSDQLIDSVALKITQTHVEQAAEFFRKSTPAVMGISRDGGFYLDFLCIKPEEEAALENVIHSFLDQHS